MAINIVEVVSGITAFSAIFLWVSFWFCICWLLNIRADKVHPENDEEMEMESITGQNRTEIENVDETSRNEDAWITLHN